jgi:hypothetical protein
VPTRRRRHENAAPRPRQRIAPALPRVSLVEPVLGHRGAEVAVAAAA